MNYNPKSTFAQRVRAAPPRREFDIKSLVNASVGPRIARLTPLGDSFEPLVLQPTVNVELLGVLSIGMYAHVLCAQLEHPLRHGKHYGCLVEMLFKLPGTFPHPTLRRLLFRDEGHDAYP